MAVYRTEILNLDAVTAQGLSSALIGRNNIQKLVLTVEGSDVRARWDGVAPTTAIGHLFTSGSTLTVEGADAVRQLQLIATAATSTVTATGEAP